jgi:hypothetical protein
MVSAAIGATFYTPRLPALHTAAKLGALGGEGAFGFLYAEVFDLGVESCLDVALLFFVEVGGHVDGEGEGD